MVNELLLLRIQPWNRWLSSRLLSNCSTSVTGFSLEHTRF